MPVNAIPRIVTASNTSTRVSPRSRSAFLPRLMSDAGVRLVVHAVHRLHERDGDEAHDRAHEDDDGRLEERRHAGELELELLAVEVGGDLELAIERASLLADAHHLHGHPGEQLCLTERSREPLTAQHPLAGWNERLREHA